MKKSDELFPETIQLTLRRENIMRYGENPHQNAAFYTVDRENSLFKQIQGKKELSYNNMLDVHAAWSIPNEFLNPTVAIIKHCTPCGIATCNNLVSAFNKALACDSLSAFGSIIAANRLVDVDLLKAIGRLFVEVIVAPSFTKDALAYLSRKKKNCRVLVPTTTSIPKFEFRNVAGGFLVQESDTNNICCGEWRVVTERQPTDSESKDMLFADKAVKFVRSNGIVIAKNCATVGIGGGQTSRVDAVNQAILQAGDNSTGGSLGSDAFFPFPDGIESAAKAGITAIIQPGGSKRDSEVIEAANNLGIAMIFTGMRHFKH